MRPILPTCFADLRNLATFTWLMFCGAFAWGSESLEVELIKELAFIEQHLAEEGVVDGIESPYDVQVSPDGKNVYIASQRNDAISNFSRNLESGELGYAGYISSEEVGEAALNGARSLAVSPDGGYVYAVSMFADSLSTFSRSTGSGDLSFVSVLYDSAGGVDGLDGGRSIVISPDGKNLYVAAYDDDKVSVFSRNGSTGAASFLGVYQEGDQDVEELSEPHALAMSPDGSHLYVALWKNQIIVFSRDASTGLLTYESKIEYLESYGTGGTHRAMRISPDGKFVYLSSWNTDSVSVFSRDAETGGLTHSSDVFNSQLSTAAMDGPHAISISADGKYLYVAAVNSDAVASFERNATSGGLTFSQSITSAADDDWNMNGPISIGTSPDGEHVYVGSGSGTHSLITFRRQAIVDPPELVVSPIDRSIEEGETVAFHALAQGVNLEYQWLKDGEAIDGETLPVFSLQTVLLSDDGSEFQIKVSNLGGILTSESATLTVLPPIVVEAPSDLTALDISSNSAQISWKDLSDNETSFEIQRRQVGGEFSTIATVLENQVRYLDETLSASTTYRYRVRAKRVETNSQWSNDAVIESYDDIPQTPVNLSVVDETYNKVVLRWSDRSAVEDGFQILRRDDEIDVEWEIAGTADKDATRFTDRGVESSKIYAYRIQAFNESGYSEYSNSVVALTRDIPVDAISPPSRTIENDAQSGYTISVTSADEWEALSDVEWLIVTSPSEGQGSDNQSVLYRAFLNESQSERVGKIVVGGIEHTVTQEGSPPFLRVSPSSTEVAANGGAKTVRVESNVDWTASLDSEWVSITSGQSGSGYGDVLLEIEENESFDDRSVELSINDELHAIEQAGVVENFEVSSDTTQFSASGGDGSVTIESNVAWSAEVSVDWISILSSSSGEGSSILDFEVAPFEGEVARSSEIVVNDVSISILQRPPEVSALAAPDWVRATAGNLGVELEWINSSDSESGLRIRRSILGAEAFELVAELGDGPTDYFDFEAQRGERYEYSIVAFDDDGESSEAITETDALQSANLVALSLRVAAHPHAKTLIAEIPIAGDGEVLLQRLGFGEDFSSIQFGSKYPAAKYAINTRENGFRLVEPVEMFDLSENFPTTPFEGTTPNSVNGVSYAALSVEGESAFPRGARALGYISDDAPAIVVGFEVKGDTTLPVLIQGLGRSLVRKNIGDGVPSLRVRVYSADENYDLTLRGENADWRAFENGSDLQIERAISRMKATRELAEDGGEARMLLDLEPGRYLVVLESTNSEPGSAMLEVFDVR